MDLSDSDFESNLLVECSTLGRIPSLHDEKRSCEPPVDALTPPMAGWLRHSTCPKDSLYRLTVFLACSTKHCEAFSSIMDDAPETSTGTEAESV